MWDGVITLYNDPGARESSRAGFLERLGRDLPKMWRCANGHETPGDQIGMATGERDNVARPLPACPADGCTCVGDQVTPVD